jgi:hypothetical protein
VHCKATPPPKFQDYSGGIAIIHVSFELDHPGEGEELWGLIEVIR